MAEVQMSAADKAREQKWESEEDTRAMERMGEIMRDPSRMQRAQRMMEEKTRANARAQRLSVVMSSMAKHRPAH